MAEILNLRKTMHQAFAIQLLKTADPNAQLDLLSPAALEREAEELAEFAVERLRSDAYDAPLELVQGLTDRQLAQYAAQLRSLEDYGQWDQSVGGAGYFPAGHNPYRIGDVKCENCVHWQEGNCQVVSGAIDPQGICRLWIIPDDLLSPFEGSPAYVNDSIRLDGKMVKWNGLDIGITHEPGMQRFPGSNPMRSYYGRINRSWGAAEDGKAIDAYLSPDFDPATDSSPIYRVMQRDPATGMMDESKYFFGYGSPTDVKNAHIYHAGAERFGAIAQVASSELDAYRKDATYHADSCGCQACAAKPTPRKKRKQRPKVAQPESEESTARVDLTREDDRRTWVDDPTVKNGGFWRRVEGSGRPEVSPFVSQREFSQLRVVQDSRYREGIGDSRFVEAPNGDRAVYKQTPSQDAVTSASEVLVSEMAQNAGIKSNVVRLVPTGAGSSFKAIGDVGTLHDVVPGTPIALLPQWRHLDMRLSASPDRFLLSATEHRDLAGIAALDLFTGDVDRNTNNYRYDPRKGFHSFDFGFAYSSRYNQQIIADGLEALPDRTLSLMTEDADRKRNLKRLVTSLEVLTQQNPPGSIKERALRYTIAATGRTDLRQQMQDPARRGDEVDYKLRQVVFPMADLHHANCQRIIEKLKPFTL